MSKVYEFMVFECPCGYYTNIKSNAQKHSTTKTCKDKTMTSSIENFVKYIGTSNTKTINTSVYIEDNSVNHNNITINLVVPEKSVVSSIYDAVKIPECIDEIRYSDPEQIPAILFKYTRGTKVDPPVIKYDPGKNVVRHKDPVTGEEVAQDLKKYRNEYLAKNADVYDDDFHIPYMPPQIQKNMRELAAPQYDNGKKKDGPIPAADVIKMCAAGDHRMYKLPHESKRFYTNVAANVDNEIKSTR